jgi:hypothetical protein
MVAGLRLPFEIVYKIGRDMDTIKGIIKTNKP